MKKEQLFDAIGEIDEEILDLHRKVDLRLARKHARKKLTARIVTVAACMTLMIVLGLSAAIMANPIGRAVVQGDSDALIEQLNQIEGFKPWQDQTVEKLEQSLPAPMWELLQTIPITNALTQSQYPAYAMKSMTFAPYTAGQTAPKVWVYAQDDKVGFFPAEMMIHADPEQYTDEKAAESYVLELDGARYELYYAYSLTQSFARQAVHVYELHADQSVYIAYLDAQTGSCIYWSSPERAQGVPEGAAPVDDMTRYAYDMLAQSVRDPEAYGMTTRTKDDLYIIDYSREFVATYQPAGTDRVINPVVRSCDHATFAFDAAGNLVGFDLAYLGALRNAEKVVPEEVYTLAETYFRSTFLEEDRAGLVSDVHDTPYVVVITKDGGLALKHEFSLDLVYQTTVSMGYIVPMTVGEIESVYEIEDHSDRVRVLLASVSLSNGNFTTHEYDQNGRKIKSTWFDGQGVMEYVRTYAYDEQGRVVLEEDSLLECTITYTYDENGNYEKAIKYVGGHSIETIRVELVKDAAGNVTCENWYDQNGQKSIEYVFEYDGQNRLIKQSRYNADGECAELFEYEYRENEIERNEYLYGIMAFHAVLYLNQYGECVYEELTTYGPTQEKFETFTYEYGYLNP